MKFENPRSPSERRTREATKHARILFIAELLDLTGRIDKPDVDYLAKHFGVHARTMQRWIATAREAYLPPSERRPARAIRKDQSESERVG